MSLSRLRKLLDMASENAAQVQPREVNAPPLIDQAMSKYYGIRQYPAPQHSPTIVRWKKAFWPNIESDSEFSWCAVFMWNICTEFGYEATKSALARDWLKVGTEVKEPQYGDVVIFSRGSEPWMGHVGFVVRVSKAHGVVYTFGGNQSNAVNITAYNSDRVLGYRRLARV